MQKSCQNIDKRCLQDKFSYGIIPESHPRAEPSQGATPEIPKNKKPEDKF